MPQMTFGFHPARRVEARFDAPQTSSDGGLLLLRQLDGTLGLCRRFARLLADTRHPVFVLHGREEQLRQRVFQIALGYEDQNDATSLRDDPLWKTACDRLPKDELGLSSQPTLSRFEHSVDARTMVALQRAFEDDYVASLPAESSFIVLDLDATADPTHGQQPLAFFHAHYNARIYFPLLVFDATGRLVTFRLRAGNAGNNKYATALMTRLVRKIKARFPRTPVLVRADSGFCNTRLLDALDELDSEFGEVLYTIGLEKNSRLIAMVQPELDQVRAESELVQAAVRDFTDLSYASRTWSRQRRVVAKAEHLIDKANPRFVVTNAEGIAAREVYELLYCQRGDAENRIKDLKRALAADRLSDTTYTANAFRLFLHALAYRLLDELRRHLAEIAPSLARAQFDTLRLRLLKVATLVDQSVRRIVLRLPRAFGLSEVFAWVAERVGGTRTTVPTSTAFAA